MQLNPDNFRIVNIKSIHQPQKFCNNKVSTAKYSVFSFLPRFLFEQFRRYSNVFFLIIAMIQQIPNISPTGRYTTLVPLVIILFLSALKEIFEDWKRHRADDFTNSSKVKVLGECEWKSIFWKDLQIGDICRVTDKERLPADLVILSSSEPQSMCYIETSNLDGETNLKLRQGLSLTANFASIETLNALRGSIECIPPNRHIYEFQGNICLEMTEPQPIKSDQLLLRGSSLRNTQWIYGVVVYTGKESKVMLNSTQAPLKQSTLEHETNHSVVLLFVVLGILTFTMGVASTIWTFLYAEKSWYLSLSDDLILNFFKMLLTGFIMFHTVVPISLQVTLELVRMFQAYFINWDMEMYDDVSDTPAIARTSNLNEELGRVKFVFSDKTGTLTRNIMEFKRCSIAGKIYGRIEDNYNSLVDPSLVQLVKSKNEEVDKFFLLLALCNTVIPDHHQQNENEPISYQASSPDENALVKAAAQIGYIFSSRSPDGLSLKLRGSTFTYQLLHILEFTSDRKRMSIVLKDPDNRIIVMTKGADSVIIPRLSENSRHQEATVNHLHEFANDGLRTLCVAQAVVDPDFYAEWSKQFKEASTDMIDRDNKVALAADSIETNLILLGATAIEDKLQEGVPQTISCLSQAGMTIWVLTGDKQETAINIGYSTKLLSQSMILLIISETDATSVQFSIRECLDRFIDMNSEDSTVGLVISGEALHFALDRSCRKEFLQLAISCKAVICCRVSPLQKAEVVNLVREFHPKDITLAIGDGANDVGMIQAAHVGVGISGLEGLQAVCSSDYAIAQFRFLSRLLLVHGAWSDCRLARVILYSFYKNIVLYMSLMWYAVFSGFSGQIMFERWSLGFFNLLFTCAPPIALGLFDRCVSAENRLKYPQLYKDAIDSPNYNLKVFFGWIVNGFYHSILIFICSYYISHDVAYANGQVASIFVFGLRIYTFITVTVCLKAGIEHNAWTWLSHFAIWSNIVNWFVFFTVYAYVWPNNFESAADMAGIDRALMGSPLFWFGLFAIPAIALTRDVVWKAFYRTYHKSLKEQVMELEQKDVDPAGIIAIRTTKKITEKIPIFRLFGEARSKTRYEVRHQSGYAFSQAEDGAVTQSDVVHAYDKKLP